MPASRPISRTARREEAPGPATTPRPHAGGVATAPAASPRGAAGIDGEGPLYLQVRRELLNGLASGEWRIGQRLPTEPELARRWGVAISTVRAGISQLVAAGILSRRQGRGTFVAPHDGAANALRFSNVYDAAERKVVTVRDIERMRRVRADADVRRQLKLPDGATVWHLDGVLRVDGRVAATIEAFLPTERFEGLSLDDIAPTRNLYAIYQQRCGITVVRMQERVHARIADTARLKRLGLERGAPLLRTERVAFTFDDVPVELRRRDFDGHRFHYLFTQDEL